MQKTRPDQQFWMNNARLRRHAVSAPRRAAGRQLQGGSCRLGYDLAMTTLSVGARLLVVGTVFVVLGTVQLIWSDSDTSALGAMTGGAVVALVGIYSLLRHGGQLRSPDPKQ